MKITIPELALVVLIGPSGSGKSTFARKHFKLTEVMSVPLPDREGALLEDAAEAVIEASERADAVVLGPGLGRAPESFALATDLIERIERPLLVDADGLNALADAGLERAARRSAPTVLTPHAGELGRLLGRPSAEIASHVFVTAP